MILIEVLGREDDYENEVSSDGSPEEMDQMRKFQKVRDGYVIFILTCVPLVKLRIYM